MSIIMVKQGAVEKELFVPEFTLISGFGDLMNEWQYKDKFSFPEDIMDGTIGCLLHENTKTRTRCQRSPSRGGKTQKHGNTRLGPCPKTQKHGNTGLPEGSNTKHKTRKNTDPEAGAEV